MPETTPQNMVSVLMEILRQLGIDLPESRLKMMALSVDHPSCVESFLSEQRKKHESKNPNHDGNHDDEFYG